MLSVSLNKTFLSLSLSHSGMEIILALELFLLKKLVVDWKGFDLPLKNISSLESELYKNAAYCQPNINNCLNNLFSKIGFDALSPFH